MTGTGQAGRSPGIAAARSAGLRYVNDGDAGIARIRHGTGFHYVSATGRRIKAGATFSRLQHLAIPPAWTDVWICPKPDGHIQATGRDDRGRKQYLYHPEWRAVRDENKYDRMLAFGSILPRLRRQIARDLRRPGLSREKVLAAMTSLLESTLIRVGNEGYARENDSFGLSTMLDRHVTIVRGRLQFAFKGKGGIRHRIELNDPRLARIVRRVQGLPGQQLFQYVDENGQVRDIKSDDLNDYLRQMAGGDFSAKDFRTWAGTVHAVAALRACPAGKGRAEARRNIRDAIARTAQRLGNTPAICRKSYIHPLVLETYLRDGSLPDFRSRGATPGTRSPAAEAIVLDLLQRRRRPDPRRELVSALRRSLARRRASRRDSAGGARAAAKSRGRKSRPSRHRRRAG